MHARPLVLGRPYTCVLLHPLCTFPTPESVLRFGVLCTLQFVATPEHNPLLSARLAPVVLPDALIACSALSSTTAFVPLPPPSFWVLRCHGGKTAKVSGTGVEDPSQAFFS